VFTGTDSRYIYDRRANNGTGGERLLDVSLFFAFYFDTHLIRIQINPEFSFGEATRLANLYAFSIGQLPKTSRAGIDFLVINKGDNPPASVNHSIIVHTDSTIYNGERLEEALFHEACHSSFDSLLEDTDAWRAAQVLDGAFISPYARDYPEREDVAESCLAYFAMKHRQDRISAEMLSSFKSIIQHRAILLDGLDIQPVTASEHNAYSD